MLNSLKKVIVNSRSYVLMLVIFPINLFSSLVSDNGYVEVILIIIDRVGTVLGIGMAREMHWIHLSMIFCG